MCEKRRKVVIYGGSFDMPTIWHQQFAKDLAKLETVDEVVVYPTIHKESSNTSPYHIANMVRLAFQHIRKVTINYYDLENKVFTRTHEVDEKYKRDGCDVWHAIGSDLIIGGGENKAVIQCKWKYGKQLWNSLNILIKKRIGSDFDEKDIPPNGLMLPSNNLILEPKIKGSSTEVREKIKKGESITGLVSPRVGDYILQNQLYLKQEEKIDEKHDFYRERRGTIERDCWLEL